MLGPLTSVGQQRRLEAKLMHVIRRLERITPVDDEDSKQKSELLQKAGSYMTDYEQLLDQFKSRAVEAARLEEEEERR